MGLGSIVAVGLIVGLGNGVDVSLGANVAVCVDVGGKGVWLGVGVALGIDVALGGARVGLSGEGALSWICPVQLASKTSAITSAVTRKIVIVLLRMQLFLMIVAYRVLARLVIRVNKTERLGDYTPYRSIDSAFSQAREAASSGYRLSLPQGIGRPFP